MTLESLIRHQRPLFFMLWFLFAFVGAFFDATYFMLVKNFVKKTDQHVLASGTFLSAALILFMTSWSNGFPDLGSDFFYAVLSTASINVIAIVLTYRALKISELSLTIPMISFTPVFLVFTSYIMLNELPTFQGFFGIILIVAGSYVLNSNADHKDVLEPIRQIFVNKGSFYMLIVAFLFSLSANFDKMVVLNSDIFFGTSIVCLLIGISFFVISLFNGVDGVKKTYAHNLSAFIVLGGLLSLIAMTINIALSMQIVPYVISVKRLSVLFSVVYGIIVFKEKNIWRKCLGALMMTIGAVLIFYL